MSREFSILIIDDDPVDRMLVNNTLTNSKISSDFHIFEAQNLEQAIDVLQYIDIDCVLLDYYMPQKNGIDCIKPLRNIWKRDLPIIMLTGANDITIAVSSLKHGASDYILKDQNAEFLRKLPHCISSAVEKSHETHAQQELEEKFSLFKNCLPYAYFIIDVNGIILEASDKFAHLVNEESSSIVGSNIIYYLNGHVFKSDSWEDTWLKKEIHAQGSTSGPKRIYNSLGQSIDIKTKTFWLNFSDKLNRKVLCIMSSTVLKEKHDAEQNDPNHTALPLKKFIN